MYMAFMLARLITILPVFPFAFFLQDEGLTWRLWVWVKTQGSTDFFFFSWYWINKDQNQSKSAKVCQVSLEVRLFDIELLLISVSPVHVIVAALTVPVLTVEILCLTMVFFFALYILHRVLTTDGGVFQIGSKVTLSNLCWKQAPWFIENHLAQSQCNLGSGICELIYCLGNSDLERPPDPHTQQYKKSRSRNCT